MHDDALLDRPSSEPPGRAPTAGQHDAVVVEQARMARDTYRLRLRCPELARKIVPGQFFMVRAAGTADPLLGRPFALYDVYELDGRREGVDFGYVVIGKLTALMKDWTPGEAVHVWGPLGNGFPPPPDGRLMMVAGGIGQTPFLAVAREALGLREYGVPPRDVDARPSRVGLCYGVRSAEYLAGLDDFTLDGLDVQIATDDGSRGRRGFVTELLQEALAENEPPDAVYCCGPEPMMHRTAEISRDANVRCWLSLETPMACGFGACFSCVTRVRTDDGWDYRRTCVEGPVFPADRLVF